VSADEALRGRRALVTGAASGIGLAIASDLARRGAQVVWNDVGIDRLNAVAPNPRGPLIGADLSRAEEVRRLAASAGPIDILVNNAGLQHVSPVEEFDESKWNYLIAVMLTAPFLLIKQLLPGMYARGWGRIITIASVHGLVASPYKSAYVSAKHGVLGLTKTVALEAAARGVTVNAVCPSYVRTPLVEKQISDQARLRGIPPTQVVEQVLLERNAVKRLIEPDQVAATVAFLCRDDAWAITGAALPMDAGWLAH